MNFVIILVSLHFLFVVGLTVRILLRDDLTPVARLAWFIVIILFPYLGVIVYILFGEVQLGIHGDKFHNEIFTQLQNHAPGLLGGDNSHLNTIEPEYRAPFVYATSVEGFNTTMGNRADFDAAEVSIDVMYYIWLTDETGTQTAQALIRAAKRGALKCAPWPMV